MYISSDDIIHFQTFLLKWYEQNKRDFPWRQTHDPYCIYISEIMSQQTQISRVVDKYLSWINTFPTVTSVSQAKLSKVLSLWSGLGYNRRALYIFKSAKIIDTHYHGIFPKNFDELTKLPGIGEYTANAILCFAYNYQIPVIDTNVKKVILTRFIGKGSASQQEIKRIANNILPMGKAYIWNQALMDYSAKILKKEKIYIPKQSKFIGSERFYRGQIIKILLQHQAQSIRDFNRYFRNNQKQMDGYKLHKILKCLVNEGLILYNDKEKKYALP